MVSGGVRGAGPARREATTPRPADRHGEIARIRQLLERAHSPRLQMMLIVGLTGAAGFLASTALLHASVDSLWLRYPLAVGVAYLVFLVLLWGWLHLRRDDLVDAGDVLDVLDALDLPAPGPSTPIVGDAPCLDESFEFSGGQFGGGGASGSFGDAADGIPLAGDVSAAGSGGSAEAAGTVAEAAAGAFDLEELALVLVAIVALIGAACAALWIVWAAPVLLAELVFDVALSAGLYRRLRDVPGHHWLRTALRRTAGPFVAVAVLFSLAGAIMQHVVPEARSVGQVIRQLDAAE